MILISYGTRPEWIKIKPIIDRFKGRIPYKVYLRANMLIWQSLNMTFH